MGRTQHDVQIDVGIVLQTFHEEFEFVAQEASRYSTRIGSASTPWKVLGMLARLRSPAAASTRP